MKHLSNLIIAVAILISFRVAAQPVIGMTTFYTTTTTPLLSNTACIPTKTVTLSGWLFSVSSTSNCGFNWTNTTGGDGRFQYLVGFGTLTQATFGSDDGSEFALQKLTWGVSTSSWTSKSMRFVGYKNGVAVPGATVNATTPGGTGITNSMVVTFTSNPAFNDVDDIWLAPISATCNSILFFEDITVGTATPTCVSPTLNVTGTSSVLCNGGSTGSATVSASGGSPFTYTWSPSGGNAASATGLSAGIYTCVITNSCGSTASRTVNITQPSAVAGATAVTNALCNGANGSATITLSGGASPYTYTWSSGPTSSVEPTLLAGTYTVRGTDANGCSVTKSVTITQPSAIVTSTAVTNVLCFGNSTGSATVTASGGTGGYTYLWSTGATTSVITGQNAGVKTVTVTDANGCTSIKSVNITQPASALNTSTTITNVLCFGNSTGAATVTASGGTAGYTYLWSSAQTTSVITGLNAGVRTVTVTDANSCVSANTVTISQPVSALTASQSQTNITCINLSGFASVNTSGGAGSYTYSWTPAGGTSSVSSALTSGNFTCSITDANNCTNTQTFAITANTIAPSVSISGTFQVCMGQSAVLAANGANTYSWSTSATTSTILASPSVLTTYSVVGTNTINGCFASATHTLIVNSIPTVSVNSGAICSGQTFTMTPSGASTYTIQGGNAVVSPTANTSYTVVGTSTAGCISANTATSSVTVNSVPTVSVNSGAICSGNSFTITPSGASTYTIQGGNAVVSPTANTNYTVTGSIAGCISSNIATSNVTVNALPTITASTSSSLICTLPVQQSATLTGSGATTYTWNPGGSGTTIVISPSITTTYTVSGTDANGCQSLALVTQIVSSCTGFNELTEALETNIQVYPNPSTDIFNIIITHETQIELTNVLGQLVLSEVLKSPNTAQVVIGVNATHLTNGIYFLRATVNGQTKTVKLIKN